MDLDELIEDFIAAKVSKSKLISLDGDVTLQNEVELRSVDLMRSILRYEEGRKSLLEHLDHPNRTVRISIAGYLLNHYPDKCEEVLLSEASDGGLEGLTAQQMYNRWKNEGWNFKP